MTEPLAKPIDILLVEDSDADAELTTRALKRGKIANTLNRVVDGVEAMEYLRGEGKYADRLRPDLILLDLNMPRMDGREVLREIQQDDDLKQIAVVILTTSDFETDVLDAFGLSNEAYIVKPVDAAQFFSIVQSLKDFWVRVVRLPDEL
ncbi:response regulator [Crateriforma conspicua]|uniref:response regulator n=1 Tax=Crateriforma conspicua TaxID=2527996 RepID=UPI00118CA7C2|nr:response regulator [Crateriforma conspicua]QDV62697.1 Response regulator rcp1 [Crateriforma conspicua]